MSRFLMKNLNIPRLSKEEIKERQESKERKGTKQKQEIQIATNVLRPNPMRSKGKGKVTEKGKAVSKPPPYRKKKITQALREQVWLARFGRVFEHKCYVTWCKNTITVFDFESGHNIPESKGGKTDLTNLYPICRKCNGSMGDRYSIDEWNALHTPIPMAPVENLVAEEKKTVEPVEKSVKRRKGWRRFFCCFT